jgi:predicted transcriptional regulator
MKKLIEKLLQYEKISVIDQMDIEKEYGITWDEINDYLNEIETNGLLISDKEVDGFEETIWEYEFENKIIRDTTVYGIGSFTIIELR